MSKTSSTTLPVPVKDVRAAAEVALEMRKAALDKSLHAIVKRHNLAIERHNASRLVRCRIMKPQSLIDAGVTVDGWKAAFKNGTLDSHSSPYYALYRTTSFWWQRLEQFVALPAVDDDKVMQVSVDDLDLIEYNTWRGAAVQLTKA